MCGAGMELLHLHGTSACGSWEPLWEWNILARGRGAGAERDKEAASHQAGPGGHFTHFQEWQKVQSKK